MAGLTVATAPVARRVRAYFAPVNRAAGTPTIFDAAQMGGFALGTPPAPWVDLGWVTGFARKSGTKVGALLAGAPAVAQTQVRTEIEATVSLEFESWGKLQMALASGSQQMNLLVTAAGAAANGSGGRGGGAGAAGGGDAGIDGDELECGRCGGGWVQRGRPGRGGCGLYGAGGVCGQRRERGVCDQRGAVGQRCELCAAGVAECGTRGGRSRAACCSWERRCWREFRRRGCR